MPEPAKGPPHAKAQRAMWVPCGTKAGMRPVSFRPLRGGGVQTGGDLELSVGQGGRKRRPQRRLPMAGDFYSLWTPVATMIAWTSGTWSAAVRYIVALNFMNMNFWLAPGCRAIILALAVGRCTLKTALAAPAIVRLGEISYSIYLAHPLISQVAFVTKENKDPLLSYVVALAFLLIFGIIT
jgi:peptidoglycan/LPS O-acetylase OafA/YrhL